MDGTIGEIRLFAANFVPKSWGYCNGALMAIRSNMALYSILGTTYGGDGQTTFGLPNLAGRSAIGAGQGLSFYPLGAAVGSNAVTLNSLNLPPHTHTATGSVVIPAFSEEGESGTPSGNYLAAKEGMYIAEQGDSALKPANVSLSVAPSGGNLPITITQPSIGMNYIICMYGTFPSRG